ncbi:uncharacterized protein LOC121234599 [Juglans microcarpa x Juglans regia]|uniref:uncharacterized protein LOC121234599 n=1 Tax=Juglans microcarpa x Juglans regia TaxID=2249226 RepID=UPI001B7E230F|nr:uncharacterized protein LOC121234599 [Juglans microcarpa x Juglans regia]
MVLVEYGGGGRRSFIFIPEGRGGMGWRNLMVVLQEVVIGDVFVLTAPTKSSYGARLSSFREVLVGWHEGPGVVKGTEMTGLPRSCGVPPLERGQCSDGNGRVGVGPYKETFVEALAVIEMRLRELNDIVGWMKHNVLGQDVELHRGLGKGQALGLVDGPQPKDILDPAVDFVGRKPPKAVAGPLVRGTKPMSLMRPQVVSPHVFAPMILPQTVVPSATAFTPTGPILDREGLP